MRRLAALLLLLALAAPPARASGPELDGPALDWEARRRWVHVDNIATGNVPAFEAARRDWLRTLRVAGGGIPLYDGRPLFWSAERGPVRTYITLHPFDRYGDLDARAERVRATNAAVGEAAVRDYDKGDAFLVPPHYSQVWSREPAYDHVPAAGALTEATARAGRLEVRQEQLQLDGDGYAAWKRLSQALAAANYPLTCRAFRSSLGTGQVILLWLAADEAALRAALPPAQAAGPALAGEVDRLMPASESYAVVRRDELSNLGR
ncbi:MAG TPA: hypothetical protein VEB20_15015 [Azospirillaceae bacterium]|nr:hypothetical protein [Azospirillaceae bacterium]